MYLLSRELLWFIVKETGLTKSFCNECEEEISYKVGFYTIAYYWSERSFDVDDLELCVDCMNSHESMKSDAFHVYREKAMKEKERE